MTFDEGDRVRHKGEGIEGDIVSFVVGKMKVAWEDGHTTLETFHNVEKVNQ